MSRHKKTSSNDSHPSWRGLHKDWRTWVVVALMLAAISIYVLTLDDSVQPGSAPQKEVPAAAMPR